MSSPEEVKYDPLGHRQQQQQQQQQAPPQITTTQLQADDHLLDVSLDSSLGFSPNTDHHHSGSSGGSHHHHHQSQQQLSQSHHHLHTSPYTTHHHTFNVHAASGFEMPSSLSLSAPSPPDSSSPVSMSSSPVPPVLLTLGNERQSHHQESASVAMDLIHGSHIGHGEHLSATSNNNNTQFGNSVLANHAHHQLSIRRCTIFSPLFTFLIATLSLQHQLSCESASSPQIASATGTRARRAPTVALPAKAAIKQKRHILL